MLSLQFEVTFSSFHLVGAVVSDPLASQSRKASKPSIINGLQPGIDGGGAQGHVVEVDKHGYSSDGDAVCPMV